MTTATNRQRLGEGVTRAAAFCLLVLMAGLLQAGVARAQWTTSGTNTTTTDNVGIGIAAPAQMFHVHSLGTWAGMRVTTNSTGTTINDGAHFGYDDTYGAFIWNREATSVVFSTSNTERARIDATGNLGIGTAAPLSQLTVGNNPVVYATQSAGVRFETTNAGNTYDRGLFVAPVQTAPASGNSVLIYSYPRIASGVTQPTQYGLYIDNNQGPGSITKYYPGIFMGGNVGIGTATPSQIFQVHSSGTYSGTRITTAATGSTIDDGVNFGYDDIYGAYVWNREASPVIFSTSNAERVRVDASGNVGIGTTAPAHKLDVSGNMTIGSGYTSSVMVPADGLVVQGAVGIGTSTPDAQYKLDVVGNVRVTGNIAAKYQDVAEWVPTTEKLSAGTVVVLDTGHDNHVATSTSSYDTRVAGVVSAQPGITLGEAGADKALVATTGRVKVKVDATQGAISVGDLLVTSDRAGYAMKSEPLMIGKRQFHSPGTIIGKALESLAGGTGEILVLLSLQ